VRSAEDRRAGCRDKFDKAKFHSIVIKLSNMLGRRGRLGSIAKVNPGRRRRNARPNENEIPTVRVVRKKNPRRRDRGRSLRTWGGRRQFSRDWNTCDICGRPRVGGMTLMSTGGIDKSLCYRDEFGKDSRCKRSKKRKNPSAAQRRAASLRALDRRAHKARGRDVYGRRMSYRDFLKKSLKASGETRSLARRLRRKYGTFRDLPEKAPIYPRRKNPSPAWGRARKAARAK
jgi:hypothetical protein